MNTTYVLTIKAEDRPGLLHLVTGVLNRKLVPIIGLSAAPTDVHEIVLITVEITISETALQPLIHKLENIIDVFAVEAIKGSKAICQRSAYFSMNKAVLTSSQAVAITKFNAEIITVYPNVVLIGKSGNDALIRRLYDALEGPYLLGFSQTGLIVDSKLIPHEDIERITGLAA